MDAQAGGRSLLARAAAVACGTRVCRQLQEVLQRREGALPSPGVSAFE
jgi:hypothetical protein